jgi:type I site-specific restriction endonuclease
MMASIVRYHGFVKCIIAIGIEIKEREKYRVKVLVDMIDQREKTLVFCAIQAHALAVHDLINQYKTSTDPLYCVRVTANDGALGDQYLRAFSGQREDHPDHPHHLASRYFHRYHG